jgi:hypothetical protein
VKARLSQSHGLPRFLTAAWGRNCWIWCRYSGKATCGPASLDISQCHAAAATLQPLDLYETQHRTTDQTRRWRRAGNKLRVESWSRGRVLSSAPL